MFNTLATALKLSSDGDGKVRHPLVRAEAIEYALANPLVPPRIANGLKDTRFVVALREPVSRLISQFNFNWQVSNLGGVCMLGANCTGTRGHDAWEFVVQHRITALWGRGQVLASRQRQYMEDLQSQVHEAALQLEKCAQNVGNVMNIFTKCEVRGLVQLELYTLLHDSGAQHKERLKRSQCGSAKGLTGVELGLRRPAGMVDGALRKVETLHHQTP